MSPSLRLVPLLLLALALPAFAAGKTWTGAWVFDEYAPPNQSWAYKLDVRPDGTAALNVDGFQTAIRFQCDVRISGDTASVYFRRAVEGNAGARYKPGALLFSLTRSASGVTTTWGAMKPMLPANEKKPVAWRR